MKGLFRLFCRRIGGKGISLLTLASMACHTPEPPEPVDVVLAAGDQLIIPAPNGAIELRLDQSLPQSEYLISFFSLDSTAEPYLDPIDVEWVPTVGSAPIPQRESRFLNEIRSTDPSPARDFGSPHGAGGGAAALSPLPAPEGLRHQSFLITQNILSKAERVDSRPFVSMPYTSPCSSSACLHLDIDLLVPERLAGTTASELEDKLRFLESHPPFQELRNCIEGKLVGLKNSVFGGFEPDVNGAPLAILLTRLYAMAELDPELAKSPTRGLFLFRDLFRREIEPAFLQSSNEGETLYIHTDRLNERFSNYDGKRICTTAVHELQHLINFFSKFLRPHNVINTLTSFRELRELHGDAPIQERYSINEGLSHLAEELTGFSRHTQALERTLVANLAALPLDLPSRGSIAESAEMDGATRAAATSLIRYWIDRMGGYQFTAEASGGVSGPGLARFYTPAVTSVHTDFTNLATIANVSLETLLTDWLHSLLLMRYDGITTASALLKYPTWAADRTDGVRFASQFDGVRFSAAPDVINWHEFNLPLLKNREQYKAASSSVSVRRYIVPERTSNPSLSISIRASTTKVQWTSVLRIK